MSLYYPDQVEITPITRNTNFRTETEDYAFKSKAYVEDDDRIVYGSDGQPVRPSKRIFLPFNTKIAEGDSIRVTKRAGKEVTDVEQRVRMVSLVGTFGGSHLEVLV